MWRIVCTLLFALALAGIVGQASAFAAPERPDAGVAMAAMPDCAEMMMQAGADDPATPCTEPGPDCMGLAASAVITVPLLSDAGFTAPPAPRRQQVAFARDDTRSGERPAPFGNPPKRQA